MFYLTVRPSAGRGLSLEDASGGSLCCLIHCKAFDDSRVKTRKCILRKFLWFTEFKGLRWVEG